MKFPHIFTLGTVFQPTFNQLFIQMRVKSISASKRVSIFNGLNLSEATCRFLLRSR
jgi:hypothetical protein